MLPLTPWSRRSFRVGPGGVEPPSSGYQPSALPLSYRPSWMGPEGLEPPLPGLKGRCAAVTPQPLHFRHTHPIPNPVQHDRQDSNPRDSGFGDRPRPQSLRSCTCLCESPVRESNPPLRLERAVSSSARRTGVRFLMPPRREWAEWRSNPRLHLFRVALDRLSYRPENGPGPALVTPGLGQSLMWKNLGRVSVSQATSGTEIGRRSRETPLSPPTRLIYKPACEHGD